MSITFYPYILENQTYRWPASLDNKFERYLNTDADDADAWPVNPEYDERVDINLANRNARIVLDALGLDPGDSCGAVPISTLHNLITSVLRRRFGTRSPALDVTESGGDGHALMIDCGLDEGYIEATLLRIQRMIAVGKEHGATHIGWA